MIILQGDNAKAVVHTDILEEESKVQIERLLDQDYVSDWEIKIMPDVHAGMGCVIGFTAKMTDKVVPNIVGVDIGCGMLVVRLGGIDVDLDRLDHIVHKKIPTGFSIHNKAQYKFDKLNKIKCIKNLKNLNRFDRSLGTLGSGNHFIELGIDSKNEKYLVIHSGSRNLGNQIANYYQKIAIKNTYNKKYAKDLCYLEGKDLENYLNDMTLAQEYASLNRIVMMNTILKAMFNKSIDEFIYFETIHNYIDFEDNIIRKGAISAKDKELVLIPINMRDGSILARGKGNRDWNYSAPHGAGRLMSRKDAKSNLKLEDLELMMKDVYTTTLNQSTIDESPEAYNSKEYIINRIDETVEIIDIIKPIYNYKG